MNLYKPSTEKQPLLFFETFLQKEKIAAYEKKFYDQPINPSQQKNISQGYIQYHKDYFEDDEAPEVKVYFADKLHSLLLLQANTTVRLLTERKLQKEFDEVFENGFVQRQLTKLEDLGEKAKALPHQDIILKVLNNLRTKVKSFLYRDSKQEPSDDIERPQAITNPYFGNKPKTTIHRLERLYDELLGIGLIDEEEVTENAFLQVFTSNKPKHKIFFRGDNYEVIYFLEQLSPFFEKLNPAQIGRSESFFTKGPTLITGNLIYRYRSALRNRDEKQYQEIKQAVIKAMPPIK